MGFGQIHLAPLNIWVLLLIVALAIVAYPFIKLYTVVPLRLRRQQTKKVHVDFVAVELSLLPADLSQVFVRTAGWLASNGFKAIGHLKRNEAASNQDCFVSIWINQSLKDMVQVIGILTPTRAKGLKVITVVGFRTDFSDGSSIVTSNNSNPSCFPADPTVDSVRCPFFQDLSLLYKFHRARIARDRRDCEAILDNAQDGRSRQLFEHERNFDRLLKAGYYSIDEAGENYVLTLKGAYLMTYRMLPPFKEIAETRKDRLADRLLRELGFGGLESFRRSQFGFNVSE